MGRTSECEAPAKDPKMKDLPRKGFQREGEELASPHCVETPSMQREGATPSLLYGKKLQHGKEVERKCSNVNEQGLPPARRVKQGFNFVTRGGCPLLATLKERFKRDSFTTLSGLLAKVVD